MAMTDYFQVLTPERWKYLCHYETTETENGGYKLTYYNEDVPVLTLEARYYDGEDQPLDSVWQGYLGRIETVDGKKYDLLSTISQYSKDASDEWKEMYDTYLDVINGIRIMDGCSLTEELYLRSQKAHHICTKGAAELESSLFCSSFVLFYLIISSAGYPS